MSYVNPIWLEGRRKYWQRHDWQRYLTPAGLAERQRAEEEAKLVARRKAEAAEQEEMRETLLWLRRELAEVKFALAMRRIAHKYDPDQPRVPAGDPKGGQWTKEGGGDAGKDGDDGSLTTEPAGLRRGPRSGLPVHVPADRPTGPEADRRRITIINNAQTGLSNVDRATEKLRGTLEEVVNRLPEGSGPRYGTQVHTEFARAVRDQNLPGIGRRGVEQTFPRNQPYGSADSIRTDVILRDDGEEPIAIYDVKTGGATLTPGRVRELLSKSKANPTIPIIEMHVIKGLSLKGQVRHPIERWVIVMRLWRPGLPDIVDLTEG